MAIINNVINANTVTPLPVMDGGTGANTLTIHGLLLGDATGAINSLAAATNGQLPIGSTGADPVLNTITAGTGISIANGAGTITIGSLVSQGIVTLDGDSGAATGTTVTLAGGNNILTAASGSTVTFNVSGTTDHAVQVGTSSGNLASLGVGTTGQVLIGSTGADPAFGALGVNSGLTNHGILLGQNNSAIVALGSATNGQIPIGSTGANPVLATITSTGGTVAITNGAGSINLETSGATANSFVTGSGTATPAAGVLTVPNGSNINTTGSGSTLTIDLVNSPSVSGSLTAGTVVSTAAGSAGSPSYTFTGNTNNGIYAPATNQLAISTASTQRMLVNATGAVSFNAATSGNNVTIAAATGSASALVVTAGSSTGPAVSIGNSSGVPLAITGNGNNASVTITSGASKNSILASVGSATVPAYSFAANTGVGLYCPGTNQVALATAATSRLSIDASGNTTISALGLGVVQSSSVGLLSSSNGTNGQLLIGNTGVAPAWAAITPGTGISVTNGTGSITIATASGVATSFPTNSGTATPSAGVLTLTGTGNISTSGSGSTATFSLSGTTNHAVQVGNSGGTLTSLGVGTTGQVLIGSTGADPAFGALGVNSGLTNHGILLGQNNSAIVALGAATNGQIPIGSTGANPVLATLTAGTNITITNGAGSITIDAAGGGGGITTLNGDTGSATGATVTFDAASNCGASWDFQGSGSTMTLIVEDANNNIFMGGFAGNLTGTGDQNIGIGHASLLNFSTATQNTAVGYQALQNVDTSNGNTAIGNGALVTVSTGSGNNTALGFNALSNVGTGTNNIGIGNNGGGSYAAAASNSIAIGSSGTGASNEILLGDFSTQTTCYIAGIAGVTVANSAAVLIDTTNGQLGTVASSERFKHNIKDMGDKSDALMQLRPVTFSYKSDVTNSMQFGLIAEEVATIMPHIVTYDALGNPYTIRYHDLPSILLNELQKLSKRVEQLEAQLAAKE